MPRGFNILLDNCLCYIVGWIEFFLNIKKYLGVVNEFFSRKEIKTI